MTAASLGTLVQEDFLDSKDLRDPWVSRGRKVRWETEETGDPQFGDPKAHQALQVYPVNLEYRDTVRMDAMASEDHPESRDSLAFPVLLVQLVNRVTATLQPVI